MATGESKPAKATGRASLRNPELRALVDDAERERTRGGALRTARADIRRRATKRSSSSARKTTGRKTAAAPASASPSQSAPADSAPRPQQQNVRSRGAAGARPPRTRAGTQRLGFPAGGGVAGNLAGGVLGLFFWSWIMLPLLKDGPTGVRNTLRAKFFNKDPSGKFLP
jgi:hypothetical protein